MSGAPALVPELGCTDIHRSRAFYCGPLGFTCLYERPEEGFACLDHHGARLMLEQLHPESWIAAPAEPPFGRGMHLQIATPDAQMLLARCREAEVPLHRDMEEAWYRAGERYLGQRQFVVQDPDGYLLRFAEALAPRASPPDTGRIVG